MWERGTQLTAGSPTMTKRSRKQVANLCVTSGKIPPTSFPTEDRSETDTVTCIEVKYIITMMWHTTNTGGVQIFRLKTREGLRKPHVCFYS